ncbi:MAG: pgeF [Herminiimonas sp.]|nr:pgeF [Herminiimonas sp.]
MSAGLPLPREWIVPDWTVPANVRALSTTRRGGFSLPPYDDGEGGGGMNLGLHVGDQAEHVLRNRAYLQDRLPGRPAWLEQVHGANVVMATGDAQSNVPRADASIAAAAGGVCAILTADCLPVLFCDSRGTVVGAAHGGWRGLAAAVLGNTVDAMRKQGAQDIQAWLGPAIGPTRFEVGEEVVQAFVEIDPGLRAAFMPVPAKQGKYLADIYRLARVLLLATGVERVSGGRSCTVEDRSRFYSYRRDGVTGRMASLIWLE